MADDPTRYADMPSFTSRHKTVQLDIFIAPTAEKEKNVVRLALIPIGCWRCNEQNFAFDSSFIDAEFSLGSLPDLIAELPDSLATLFGHADPVGDDGYNHTLSGRRAKATYAILTRNVAIWHELYEQPFGGDAWGERSTKTILSKLPDPDAPDGAPYYAGSIDERVTPDYLAALHKFQADNGVPQANTATRPTRDKLYPAYMKELCGDFQMKPEQFLGKGADGKGKGDYQGCSEHNPVVLLPRAEEDTKSEERDEDNAPNRRVVMFLFRDDVDVKMSDWPCPRVGEGPTKCHEAFWPGGEGDRRRAITDERRDYAETGDTMACRFYDRFARRSPCEGRAVVVHEPNTIEITTDAPQFAPLTEKLEIGWTIGGPIERVSALRLVVVAKAAPDQVLLDKMIEGPYAAKGSYPWDGAVTDDAGAAPSDAFDTCINVKSSPYVLKIVLEADSGAQKIDSNTKDVAVELLALDIRVEEVAAANTPKELKSALRKLKSETAANGGTGRIILDSPVFTRGNANELTNDSSFKNYEELVHDGLLVPLLARVWLKGKDGTKKRSPHALEGLRVLWDMWLDSDADYDAALAARGMGPAAPNATAYVKKVSAYKKDESKPKGRTAHTHLGGLRSDAPAYFSKIDDSWPFSTGSQRTWGALTNCGAHEGVSGDAGLKLKPGRMATDAHHVRAYVDVDQSLDTTGDKTLEKVPAERRSNDLHLTVWRRIEIQKVLKLAAGVPDMPMAPLAAEYKKAGMIVDPGPSFSQEDKSAAWKVAYKAALDHFRAEPDEFISDAALDDPENFPARFISREDYWEKKHPGASLPEKVGRRLAGIFGAYDDGSYGRLCDEKATKILQYAVKAFAPFPPTGVTVFAWASDSVQNRDSHVGGFGGSASPHGLYGDKSAGMFVFRTDDAGYAHELGHCLYLAHGPGAADEDHPPKHVDVHAHDANATCIMSYAAGAAYLCGQCILKLAGWDVRGPGEARKIDEHGNVT